LLIQALIFVNPDDAVTIHSAIPGSVTDGQGDFAFPCSTSVQLAVIFAGKSFTISPKDYVGQPLNGGNNLCQSNIVGQQVGVSNQWLLGDVFLKNVFPCFKEV
jgi:cathepsin D